MILQPLLDLVFPPACEVCRRRGPDPICPACFAQIKFMNPQLGVYSASAYEGVLREALHKLKFQKRQRLVEPLGIALVQYLSHAPGLKMEEIEVIVPVPLHRQRQRERGFNQAELLARVVSRYYEVPVIAALARTKPTKPQFDLPREARFHNIKGAFKVVNNPAVYNKKVMLFDDIYTTGATVGECVRVLKIAGAKRIEILTLSRAVE